MKSTGIVARASRRRGKVVVLALLCLLNTSCLEKVAHQRTASPSQVARFSDGGGGGGYAANGYPAMAVVLASPEPDSTAPRKLIRNGSLELLVNDVGQATGKITSIASGVDGYVEKVTQTNSGGHTASITVRVPAPRLDQVISDVKRIATSVDRETIEVRDVTREYVDLDARLRNAQAEEAQYLQIMKRAASIKDTLDVTEKLSDVRGRIEQMQGEMKLLTSQIDLSTLEISLRAEADESIAGIRWKPLRQAKIAVNDMVSGLADWADSVIAFFIDLPLIAVWLVSIIFLIVVAIRLVRFSWRRFGPKTMWQFPWRRAASKPAETKS